MTQEEKQLLLKDLCARLPYRVKLGFENSNVILALKDYCCFTQQLFTNLVFPEHEGTVEYGCQIYDYRPYLRPMSSITEEERKNFADHIANNDNVSIPLEYIDWLNSHHFDYRGLIEKGLALEAPADMYKIE